MFDALSFMTGKHRFQDEMGTPEGVGSLVDDVRGLFKRDDEDDKDEVRVPQRRGSFSPSEVSRRKQLIDELDFRRVQFKLVRDGGFTEEGAVEGIRVYRMFLKLCLQNKGLGMPIGSVDQVWHCHILDTANYHADCQRVFGEYLHHEPCVFFTPEEEVTIRQPAICANKRTVELMQKEFGHEAKADGACWNNCNAWCGDGTR